MGGDYGERHSTDSLISYFTKDNLPSRDPMNSSACDAALTLNSSNLEETAQKYEELLALCKMELQMKALHERYHSSLIVLL